MAPARSSNHRAAQSATQQAQPVDPNVNKDLFLEPMFGTPLSIYIEKDVDDKEAFAQLVIKHGGTVATQYSNVQYILVDPHKPSGKNLWKQYGSKKGKVVLNVRWIHECIKANQLHTFTTDWGGCKVTGDEEQIDESAAQQVVQQPQPQQSEQPQQIHPHALHPGMAGVEQMHPYPFSVYPAQMHQAAPRGFGPVPPGTTWHIIQAAPPHLAASAPPNHIAPAQTEQQAQAQTQQQEQAFRNQGTWTAYGSHGAITAQPQTYEYARDQAAWAPGPYYEAHYDPNYPQPPYIQPEQTSVAAAVTTQPQMPVAGPSRPSAPPPAPAEPEKRGRKRTRTQPPPATPATALVVNRNPPARSPTPPSRIVKSTYGGNLFTSDDVEYLKKYIDYCQDQCLVLSLREICERIAVKAPHHTFYSWRRYCNKHQIKLGGYAMNHEKSQSPRPEDPMAMDLDGGAEAQAATRPLPVAGTRLDYNAAIQSAATAPMRTRSPTPPRALFRSTTGKGVAFTQEDVEFLVKFMAYRKHHGTFDLVEFWRDVATKAPHHSRASWMKFWRRHKHELDPSDGDAPLPAPPDKKMRYSKGDDVLLAKYFYNKPDGTSDKVFQAFGRLHPHHPWKGWQEHHRIHKSKIELLMQKMNNGENLETLEDD